MKDRRKLVSLVIPVLNEEENIKPFYQTVLPIMQELSERYIFELVFTDNHSTDSTFEILAELSRKDDRIRAYRFSKDFGYQRSIATGYEKSKGDAVIQLDCDLQDPPSLISEFLRIWERGYKVVYGVRRTRMEGAVTNIARKAFYRLIDWVSEDELPHDAGDFRLVDRSVVEILKNIYDAQPYIRGTIAALGFEQIGVKYDRAPRKRGKSKFPLRHMIRLAVDGICNHSVVPLRLATYTGLLVSAVTLGGILVYLGGRLFFGTEWPAGFATTTLLLLFSLTLNALFLGIIGEYLGRIYKQVKKRPLTIIESSINDSEIPEGKQRRTVS